VISIQVLPNALISLYQDPYKSSVLFAALVVIWFFLVLVPTRVIVLIGGLVRTCWGYCATTKIISQDFGQF
jgi:hypothetical protein